MLLIVQKLTIKYRKVFFLLFLIGAWQGIREVFPDVSIKGCVFHWTQAVWRHVQEYGLVRTYRERQAVYWYIRQLLALPFLPATHIRETFDALRVRANTDPLMRLVDYIDRQWMLNSVFDVPSWSVYGQSVRTNNDVEGRCSFMGLIK